MANSTKRLMDGYHLSHFHSHLHKPAPQFVVETMYAYQMGPVTAAIAAHGVTNVWQGVPVVPLDNSDEIHVAWATSHNFDAKHPFYLRWGLIANDSAQAITLTTTVDFVDMGATHTGSDTAGDGATALSETIAAITTTSAAGTNKPYFSVWGKINGRTTDFDALFVKLVASGVTGADTVRVWCLQIAYRPLTA